MNEELPEKIGQYEIDSVLGHGGMSTVYRGTQQSLNRSVAIKVLPIQMAEDDELVDRFEREASIIAGLSHPNIIQVFDRGIDNGRYYIVMEYIDGVSLDELTRKRLPIYHVVDIALQIAKGLEYAHSKGVVHRDIKPSNILVSGESGTIKITDFGIAKLSEQHLYERTLTRDKMAMGTADYMSPEQRRDSRNIDSRSDIFSYGVLFYKMLTGRVPVGRFKDPNELRDDTPPLLNQIVLRCLQEDPEDRYMNFTEVIAELNKLTERGMAYRQALARMVDSVSYLPRKATTAFSRGRNASGRGKIFWLTGAAVIAAVVLFFRSDILSIINREGPEEPGSRSESPRVIDFAPVDSLLTVKKYDEALSLLGKTLSAARSVDDTGAAAEAQWRIASIHEELGNIAEAGLAYADYVDTYGTMPKMKSESRMADALFLAGMYRADEGDFARAMKYLSRLRKEHVSFPRSQTAMMRELSIFTNHSELLSSDEGEYRNSLIEIYRTFADRFPDSDVREEVLWQLSKAYLEIDDISIQTKAVDALEVMARDYPESGHTPLYVAAEICRVRLDDRNRARRLYQEFLETNPGSDRADDAGEKLKNLQYESDEKSIAGNPVTGKSK